MQRFFTFFDRLNRTLGLLILVVVLAAGCNNNADAPAVDEAPAGEPAVVETTPAATAPAPAAEESSEEAAPSPAPEQAANTAAPSPTPAITQGRVVLWHAYAGADGEALAAILAQLQRDYPDLTVETLFVTYDDLPQSYSEAVTLGGGPDLVALPAWWLTEMVAAQVVQPLDELTDAASRAGYFPAALADFQREGALYGLPATYQTVSLYVNSALIGDVSPPAATDAMLSMAQETPDGGSGLYANLYHLAWGLPAYGATLMADDGTVTLDQGDGAADFLTWLKALDATPAAYVSEDYGMLLDRFKKGEFAFFVDGPWAIPDLRAALGDDLAVAPLPAGPAGPARPWLSAEGILLNPNKDANQQQRALLVAQALSNGAAGSIWASRAGRLPAHQDATLGDDPLLQGFAEQATSAQPYPYQPEMAEVWGYAGDMLLKTLNDVMSPEEAVIETTTLINEANGK
ncbi:MAG: extracellular solute-binding protein [Caldilineaceae bacterium]|nr:extracellular solute-binding protein [Caldilineaceae bacterium]